MECEFERYIIHFLCVFLACLILYLIYPWRMIKPQHRFFIHFIPIVCLALYLTYEYNMLISCPTMNIRLDIFLTWPMIGTVLLLYLLKSIFIKNRIEKN